MPRSSITLHHTPSPNGCDSDATDSNSMSSKSDSNYFDDSSSLQPTKRAWPFEEIVNEEQKAKKNRTEVILSI